MAGNTVASDLDLNNLGDDDIVTTIDSEEEVVEQETEAVQDNTEDVQEEPKADEKEEEKPIDVLIAELEEQLENTNKRYDASSIEGKRLYEENKALKEERDKVKPILEILAEKPELQEIAKQMIQGTYQNVPDERVDLDDAVRDPNSVSAKTLNTLVEQRAAALIKKHLDGQNQEKTKTEKYEQLNNEINAVAAELKLDEGAVSEIMEFGKNLSFKDIAILYKTQNSKKETKPDMLQLLEQIKQLQKTNNIPSNVNGSDAVNISIEDKYAKIIRDAGGANNLDELIPT